MLCYPVPRSFREVLCVDDRQLAFLSDRPAALDLALTAAGRADLFVFVHERQLPPLSLEAEIARRLPDRCPLRVAPRDGGDILEDDAHVARPLAHLDHE